MKPPEMLEGVEYEDVSYHAQSLIDIANLMSWSSVEARREFISNAAVIAGQTPESGYMRNLKETAVEEATQHLVRELYWLYQELKYETDVEGALEGMSPDQLYGLEETEEFLGDYVSGKPDPRGYPPYDEGDQWAEDYYIPGFDNPNAEGGYVLSKYQDMIPERIRNNPYMFKQYQLGLKDLLNSTRAADELHPYYGATKYSTEERDFISLEGEAEGTTFEPFIDIVNVDRRLQHRHPDIQAAIGEAWRKRAMTEGTPERAQAIKYGGEDPRFWIESTAALLTQGQWTPAEYENTALYDTADALNAGWQQSTSSPGGQLAMESAERLFAPMTGADAPERTRNRLIDSELPEATQSFKVGLHKYEEMNASDVVEFLDDPERQAEADDIVEKMYDDTQQWFREMGYSSNDTVPLYRGMNNLKGDWNSTGEDSDEVDDAEIESYSLSSWSANVGDAVSFASRGRGAVIKAMIPVSRILANAQTGFPCQKEQEYVVIGGPGIEGTVYRGWLQLDTYVHDLPPDTTREWVSLVQDKIEDYEAPIYQPLTGGVVRAMDVGGGFSIAEDSEMQVRGGGKKMTVPADVTGEDWIAEHLAAFNLTRGLLDGTDTTDAEGNELSEDEINLRIDKFYIAKRKAGIQGTKSALEHKKKQGPVTQRSYPAPHCGREGEQGGSAPRDECAAGSGETEATGTPTKGKANFSHPMPNEDALVDWFERHRTPADKIEMIATTTHLGMLSQFSPEEKEVWLKRRELIIQDTTEELKGVDWETFDKDEFMQSDEKSRLYEALTELSDKAGEEGNEELESYYADIGSELYMSDRFKREALEFALLQAVANGEVSVEVAGEIEYRVKRPDGDWSSMPETLYHTTTAGSAIREEGIKSRFELSGSESALGGGNDKTISYTADEEWAKAIERTIQEAQQVGAGEVTAADLLKLASEGVGNNGDGFLSNMVALGSSKIGAIFRDEPRKRMVDYLNSPDFDPTKPVPEDLPDSEKVQAWLDFHIDPETVRMDLQRRYATSGDKPYSKEFDWYLTTPEERKKQASTIPDEAIQTEMTDRAWDLYKYQYLSAREYTGGHKNPLIWGGSAESFAAIDPNEIVTFVYKPKEGALGVKQSALDEWRSYGGANVDVVDELNLFEISDLWTEKSRTRKLVERIEKLVGRGGEGSGFSKEAGHVGIVGEQGGSQKGTPSFGRPGMSAYGSGVFNPMLKEVLYGWKDQKGWNTSQSIYANVVRAKEMGDEEYQGLAIGEDGILQGIGALDYNASNPDFEELVALENPEFNIEDYLKIDGLYTPDPAFSEELMVQMAAEAAKHGKGVWMIVTDESGAFAAQMGMSLVDETYAYWTPEQVAEVAQKATGLEPTDYYSPPDKPRMIMSFDDAYTETTPSNPTTGQSAPVPVGEMSVDERYRWENFNYSNWAQPESWNPEEMAREQLGIEDEEERLTNMYDIRVVEDLQNIHDGWIEGTDSPWSVRFSEAVAYVFGGDPIPVTHGRDEYDTPQEYLDFLAQDYGVEVVIGSEEIWEPLDESERWDRLDEFNAFASGARDEDIATDLTTVVQSMYDTTQAKFKEAGYTPGDTVRLYRGLQSDPEERLGGHDGGWANIKQWAVSSWSSAKVVAGNFATMEGQRSTIEETGTLLTADIPIELLLCNWQTGPGSHGEFEYLVLGEGGVDAYATKAYSNRMYRDAKEGVAIEHGESLYDAPEYALGPEIE
jgi:hypothetical protein